MPKKNRKKIISQKNTNVYKPYIRRNDALKELKNHQTGKRIKAGNNSGFVIDNKHYYGGITQRLNVILGNIPIFTKTRDEKNDGNGSGLSRGIHVHQTIQNFICNNSIQTSLGLDPMGIAIINHCKYMLKLSILSSEVPVFCEKIHRASSVDLVAYDTQSKEYILLEIKTGYGSEDNYSHSYGCMKRPFSKLKKTHQNAHQIQLLITYVLFTKTFPNLSVNLNRCRVVRVHGENNGVSSYVISSEIKNLKCKLTSKMN
jgi:hypothetical protein